MTTEETVLLARIKRETAERKAAIAALRAEFPDLTDTQALIKSLRNRLTNVDEQITTQSLELETARAEIEEVSRVGVGDRAALAEQITTLSATVKDVESGLVVARSRIEELATVAATDQYAFAQFATDVRARFASNDARFNEQVTLLTTTDTALATRTTSLEASIDTPTTGLIARVATIESAYVDANGAEAIARSEISAALTGPTGLIYASVQSEASARAAADGNLSSKYTLKVIAGNVVTGMNLTSSTGGGTDVSDITFQASSFKIFNGSTGVAPFQVVGGVVKITGSLVVEAGNVSGLGSLATQNDVAYSSVTGTKPPADADNTEGKLQTGTTITGGGITLASGGAIKGGASDFSNGVGFFLGYEGGQYKFRVGDPGGARISWDGSTWTVVNFGSGTAPTFNLTLSNSTGNPIYNPTGGGTYASGSIVTISAPGYAGASPFVRWSGSNIDQSCVENLYASTTTVVITHDTALSADY